MHSARLVIFYLVCPRRRGRRTYWPPEICNSPLSPFRIIKGEYAITAISEQTRYFFFFLKREEDFAQMSLEALVIVATAVEAHGPSFEKPSSTTNQNSTCQKWNTHTARNTRFLNSNAISPLRSSDFYCLSFHFYRPARVVSVIAYLPP